MVAIPPQLWNGWRFVPVKPGQKKPFENDWPITANYAHDDPRLTSHKGPIGAVAGNSHFTIDCDDEELERLIDQAILEGKLPRTYTQLSGGRKRKQYFYNGSFPEKIPIWDRTRPKAQQHLGEIIAGHNQVLVAGSIHPSGGTYTILDPSPVVECDPNRVREVLAVFIAEKAKKAEMAEAEAHHAEAEFDILQVVSVAGMKRQGDSYQGSHPLHGSTTGTNFHVTPKKNVWHCFRCCSGGGPWQWLAVSEGIIRCDESVPGGLRGELFKKTKRIALERGLIKKPAPPKFDGEGVESGLTEDTKHNEVAEAVLGTFRIASFWETDEILVYNDGVYHLGGEGRIAATVENKFREAELGHVCNNHLLNEVLGHVKRRTSVDRRLFDQDPFILNLTNGLLDLRTFEVKPHTPDHLSLVQLPVRYDPNADCPRWKQFLSEVLHWDDLQAVQEYVGFLFWKGYETQKAWLQVGEGANGKDTLDRVLVALLGPENVSGRSLQDLEDNRFARADLFGKLANVYSDLRDTALKTTGAFKTLTGEGSLSAERKFQNAFTFANHAKLIFSCNKIPMSPDDTDAFFRRWFITVFPNKFLGDKADADLAAKLTTPEELSGILNWALEGLKRLRGQNWQLSNSKSVEEIREDYIRKSDPVKSFVIYCCLPDPEGAVPKQLLFQAFVHYCELSKLPPVTSDTFYKRLPMAGVPVSSAKLGPEGKRVPSFKGLWLRKLENWEKEVEEDEKPLVDQELLDLNLRREKGGQSGHPGHETPVMSNLSTLSGGSSPKVEVDTGKPTPDSASLRDLILNKVLPELEKRQGYAAEAQVVYACQEKGCDGKLVLDVLRSLLKEGTIFQPRQGCFVRTVS